MYLVLNKTFHSITNRLTTPEEMGSLTVNTHKVTDENADSLRKALGLEGKDWWYYARVYMNLIETFPELQRAFEDNFKSYTSNALALKPPSLTNGVTLKSEWKKFNPVVNQFPVPTNIHIKGTSPARCRITFGEESQIVGCSIHDSQTLQIEFPKEFNIQGEFVLPHPTWGEGSEFSILVEPSLFPYRLALKSAVKSKHFVDVLTKAGFLEHYIKAPTVEEKLAITVASIGFTNKTVYCWIK